MKQLELFDLDLGHPPPILLWENVPGVLNTKDNAFGCFLAGIVSSNVPLKSPSGRWPNAGFVTSGKIKAAWRVLDAQHFGVPQRRKRVFVIASDFNYCDPCKILFERPSLRRHSETCASKGKDTAAFSESSFGGYSEMGGGIAGTCRASGGYVGGGSENLILDFAHHSDVFRMSKDRSHSLTAHGGTGGNNTPCVVDRLAVRRLTPIECERLQGFPDNWTKIPYRGRDTDLCPDSPRYKAIGNSWAVPVVNWLGKRIENELQRSM